MCKKECTATVLAMVVFSGHCQKRILLFRSPSRKCSINKKQLLSRDGTRRTWPSLGPARIDMEMRIRGTVEHGKRRDERDIESTNVGWDVVAEQSVVMSTKPCIRASPSRRSQEIHFTFSGLSSLNILVARQEGRRAVSTPLCLRVGHI